jgi:hypothetical protein
MGNNILKPIIEEQARKATDIDIKLDKFSLRFSSIDIEATLMEHIKGKVYGGISLFGQSFDLDYSINADKLPEIEGVKIDEPLKVEGEIVGDLNLFNAHGAGDIFKSALNFNVTLKDFNITAITANVKELKISKLLAVLKQPIYADGEISADVHVTPNEKSELFGNAFVIVDNGIAFKSVLQKEFNLTLDKNPSYKISSNFSMQEPNKIRGGAEIVSSLANLKILNANYDLDSAEANGDYTLDMQDLREIETIAGMQLRGAVKIYGDIKYAPNQLELNAKSDNVAGGKLDAKLDNDKFSAKLLHVKIEEILKALVYPNYASGDLNIMVDFSSLSNKNGKVDVEISSGELNAKTLQNEFNLTVAKTEFNVKSNVSIQNGIANFDVKFLSSLMNLDKFIGNFNMNKNILKSNYLLNIKDLSKFNTIVHQKLVGALSVEGAVNYENDNLHANGESNVLDGKVSFDFNDMKVALKGDDLSSLEVLNMLSYPPVLNAKIALNAAYNIDKNSGTFNATSPSGRFVKTQLGDLLKTFTNFDMTSEIYNNMLLEGKINGANINFLFDMKSTKSSISIKEGKILGNTLDIPFVFYIEKTDLEGKVTGTTDKPKVSVNNSQYLKNKAIEEANKYLEKNSDKIDKAVGKALDKLFK